jgi:tetratricopeptide (TPR) repeat protein
MVGRRNKKLTMILIVLVLVVGSLSGCIAEKKLQTEDEAFKEYVTLLGGTAPKLEKSIELEKTGKAFLASMEYDEAIKKFEESKSILEEVKDDYLKAYNIIQDEELKRYAYYSIKQTEYSILFEEARIKGISYLKVEDINASERAYQEAQEYLIKNKEWNEKRRDLHQKLKEEGKL